MAHSLKILSLMKALEANYKIVEVLREFGASKNASSAQVALAYLLAKKPYIVPLFGTTDSKHLREDIGALDVSFSASEWQSLEAKLDKIEIVGDRYPKEQSYKASHHFFQTIQIQALSSKISHKA